MNRQPCANCRDLVEELEETVRQLRANMTGDRYMPPHAWALTPSEQIIMRALCSRPIVTREYLRACLEAERPDWDCDDKIFDVWVCKIRSKTAAFGVKIETRWGVGYFIPDEVRPAIQAACEGVGPAVVGDTAERPMAGEPVIAILREALKDGPWTARDLYARVLMKRPGACSSTVQTYLSQMQASGEVRPVAVRKGVGRVARVWSLSEAAA